HGKTHFVVDIHERQWTRGIRAGTGHISAARSQSRKFIADAATRFESEAGLMDLLQDIVHGIADRSRYGAIDGGSRRLVLERACIGRDPPGRNCAMTQ